MAEDRGWCLEETGGGWRKLEETGGVCIWQRLDVGGGRRWRLEEGEVRGHSLRFCPEVGARRAALDQPYVCHSDTRKRRL